jgi:ankyrin repeat protein
MDTLQRGGYRNEQMVDDFLALLRGEAAQARTDDGFTQLLGRAYDRNIARVTTMQNGPDNKIASWILATIRDARRHMTTTELRTALALLQHGTTERSTIAWSEISSICQSLVDEDDMQHVRFLHGTLRTHLESPAFKAQGIIPDANKDLGAICVRYLLGLEVPGQCRNKESLQGRLRDWPLYDYAAKYWGYHTRKAWSQQSENELSRFGEVLDLLRDERKVQAAFQVATIPSHALQTLDQQDALKSSPNLLRLSIRAIELGPSPTAFPSQDPYTLNKVVGLHVACLYDLVRAVAKIVADRPLSLQAVDCRRRQALHFAAEGGSVGAIRNLIKAGSNVSGTDERGITPLMLATMFEQYDAIKELTGHGGAGINAASASVDPSDTLFLPVLEGFGTNVSLLPWAKVVGTVGLRTSLHWACRQGNLETVDRLLSFPDISVNVRDSDGQTPYHKAAKKGHLAVVKRLLENPQVDPFQIIINPDDPSDGATALHLAASYPGRGDGVAKHLITTYPRLSTILDKSKDSPLHCAIQGGSLNTARILLKEETVDTNSANDSGMCPLEMAASVWIVTSRERFDLFTEIWRHPKTQQSSVDPDNYLAGREDTLFYKIVQNRTEQWDPDPLAELSRPTWRRRLASRKAQEVKFHDFYRSTPRSPVEFLDLPRHAPVPAHEHKNCMCRFLKQR